MSMMSELSSKSIFTASYHLNLGTSQRNMMMNFNNYLQELSPDLNMMKLNFLGYRRQRTSMIVKVRWKNR